jgi:hypothetical protein
MDTEGASSMKRQPIQWGACQCQVVGSPGLGESSISQFILIREMHFQIFTREAQNGNNQTLTALPTLFNCDIPPLMQLILATNYKTSIGKPLQFPTNKGTFLSRQLLSKPLSIPGSCATRFTEAEGVRT